MRIYTLTDSMLDRCVIDPRPTLEAEARVDQGWERALYWKHVNTNWELHSANIAMAPARVPA